MEAGDGGFWLGWLSEKELLVRLGNKVGIYNAASRSYQVFTTFDLAPNTTALPSPDGSLVAIGGGGRNLAIVDMRSQTYRELSTLARPNHWSPDSSRLLLNRQEGGTHSVLEMARLDREIRLPDSGYYSGWLSDFQVLANAHILVHVRAPDRKLELPGGERGHFSPDGSLIAVSRVTEDSPGPDQRRFATNVYTIDPFTRVQSSRTSRSAARRRATSGPATPRIS